MQKLCHVNLKQLVHLEASSVDIGSVLQVIEFPICDAWWEPLPSFPITSTAGNCRLIVLLCGITPGYTILHQSRCACATIELNPVNLLIQCNDVALHCQSYLLRKVLLKTYCERKPLNGELYHCCRYCICGKMHPPVEIARNDIGNKT